jgi:type IV pilus assembly protein PilV
MVRPAMKDNTGMTLVEVLVSLVIVFVVFLGLSASGLVVLNENIKNEMRDEAVNVAEMEMQNVRNIPFTTINDNTHLVNRQIRNVTVGYNVARTVANPDGTTPATDPNNRRVTINVTWTRVENQGTRSYSHQVATFVRQR